VTNTERTFGCDHTVPTTARAWARETTLSMLPAASKTTDVVDDVEIIVSELVTNAVLARCTTLRVCLDLAGGCVRVEVGDDAGGWPTVLDASPADAHGRGLAIVAALATHWGVRDDDTGKVVWAELTLPASVAKRLP
jgi:anti-sigma regulatory factor (Ser/Thr protein kinase)